MKAGVALLISDKTDFRAKKKKQNMWSEVDMNCKEK